MAESGFKSNRMAQSFRMDAPLVEAPAPLESGVSGTASRGRFRKHRLLRTPSARRALEPFEPGTDYEVITNGEFSLLDCILVLLERSGPAHVAICTYSAGLYDVEVLYRFTQTSNILSLRFVLDVAFRTLSGSRGYAVTLMDVFGEQAIRTTRTHAKFVTIINDTHHYSISSTANLNENKRLELFAFSDNPERAAFFERIVDDIFDGERPGWNPNLGAPGFRADDDEPRISASRTPLALGRVEVG